jgi:hypothetical protein
MIEVGAERERDETVARSVHFLLHVGLVGTCGQSQPPSYPAGADADQMGL